MTVGEIGSHGYFALAFGYNFSSYSLSREPQVLPDGAAIKNEACLPSKHFVIGLISTDRTVR